MIGARLKLARAATGLSLRELEEKLGAIVSAQAIGKYERDEMMPSSDVLIALAKALEVSVAYLMSASDVELVDVEFRKKELTPKEAAAVQARILSAIERYISIEHILAIELNHVFTEASRPFIKSLDDAEIAALELRKKWKLGEDPIPNLCEFLEEKGIKICSLELPDGVSGVQANVRAVGGKQIPVVVLNSSQAGERQRFTLAHELGHMYLRFDGHSDREKACNRFAGAFLIPKPMLLREAGPHRSSIAIRELFQLKLRFGTSAQAIVYRLKDLEVINRQLYAEIFRVFAANKWKLQEPLEQVGEPPMRFQRLCYRALSEGVISESKAAELLKVSVRKLQQLIDEPPESEAPSGHPSGV